MQRNQGYEAHPLVQQILARVPPESEVTFSDAQLALIESVLRPWRGTHPINIRVSIPLWRRFYFILLIGPERRSPERREDERENHPLWVLANIAAFGVLFLGVGLLTLAYGPAVGGFVREVYFFFLRQIDVVRDVILKIFSFL
jgi:hypothetical protein